MLWIVRFEDEFEQEFLALEQEVQDELLAVAKLLAEHGPQFGRPYVDTLKGSKHTNMKELRFDAMRGVWRVALLSILADRVFCWSPATSRERVSTASRSS
ncbi:MAG: type II toxin-antitoxin system RelE/ParE family toxin [Xanthobacteraceae bacterium]